MAEPDVPADGILVSDSLVAAFYKHVDNLQTKRRKRKAELELRGVASQPAEGVDGAAASSASAASAAASGDASEERIDAVLSNDTDTFEGDGVLRTLQALLSRIDGRGYARSRQQLAFHDAFVRACSRVLYRNDWASNRPAIMKSNGWEKCPSEILISTPRYAQPFSAVPWSMLSRPSLLCAQTLWEDVFNRDFLRMPGHVDGARDRHFQVTASRTHHPACAF